LKLSSRMGQGTCCYCFSLQKCSIPDLWMFATNRQLDYPGCRTKIMDTVLMLIFKIAQRACRYWFCIWRQPVPHLWMIGTIRHLGYPRCKATNRWRSIDANFQNGAETVWLSHLAITPANPSVIHNSDLFTFQLPYLRNQELLTLHWRSFYCTVHSQSVAIDNSIRNDSSLFISKM